MPPPSSEAAGSSTSRTSSKASIFVVTTPYQHSQRLYGHFFVENENTFLSALGAPTTSPETSKSGHSPARERTQRNRFERLPYEILMLVLEHLDIASLVTIASVNTHVRGLVQGLGDVEKIQHNICAARAVSRMYTIGTGQFFSLKDFMAAFTSWTCGRFGARDGFAVRFSLMWCLRICRCTCQSGAILLGMALQCFGLGREEIVRHVGFARAHQYRLLPRASLAVVS
jgi:hypothetical protein